MEPAELFLENFKDQRCSYAYNDTFDPKQDSQLLNGHDGESSLDKPVQEQAKQSSSCIQVSVIHARYSDSRYLQSMPAFAGRWLGKWIKLGQMASRHRCKNAPA